MYKEDIRIKNVIVHICDSTVGMPILSNEEIEYGSEFADFLKEHIYKIVSGDDCKTCNFYKEQSEIYKILVEYSDEFFVDISKDIASLLYEIMNSNIDIPAADLLVVRFKEKEEEYLALLKMDYKESYTHKTKTVGEEQTNEIIKYKTILPNEKQKLIEAAVININDFTIQLIEKKYEVNGEKTNYFSYLFLKCSSQLSHKTKLAIVAKAVATVQKEHFSESEHFEQHMKAKSIINDELVEVGSFVVESIAEKIFVEEPELQIAFQDIMEKYDMVKEEIAPVSESTTKKFQKQQLITDSGIEIKIPMEQYKDTKWVEFITNQDGTTSVLIKNIGHLTAKF